MMRIRNKWLQKMVMGVLPFCLFTFLPLQAQVGTWHNYLAYSEVQQIQDAGNYLFVRASNDLYQYNKNDQSITTYDKTNGLNDTNINIIRWCQQAKRLVIVYHNLNIDLIDTNGNTINISDIYKKAITGAKTINSITVNGQYAYLACGFGIIKLNVKNAEISETYLFDNPVVAITFQGDKIYAQTEDGTVWTGLTTTNLIDKSNWSQTTSSPSFAQDNSDYDNNITLISTLLPGGPKYNLFGYLRMVDGTLYSVNNNMEQKSCIQVFNYTDWTSYENDIEEKIGHRYVGLCAIDVDPKDKTHVICAGQTGVYEYKNGKFVKEHSNDNSPLQTAKTVGNNNKDYLMVTDGIFDSQGNYWCLNSISPSTSLLKLTSAGEWINDYHSEKFMLNTGWSMDDMRSLMFDSYGTLWFCNNFRAPAVIKYDLNQKEVVLFDHFINQDGIALSVGGVRCIAKDSENNIWAGTNAGLLLLERKNINENADYFTQVKVPRNDGTNYADYLLSGIDIKAIAIDGANRKWIGTNGNGVYLISSDNMEQVYHFTVENSPLLSNTIFSIAINGQTGEVFFGTEEGLCSYISNSTVPATEMTKDSVWAYPNPVTPGYTGLITITGLTYNADVKIVSSNGALITEGKSNGGTFTWDGTDSKGRRVASGVYMVVTATKTGEKGTVCKIAVIN